jgi:valyl-tRNA synthetase
MIAEYPSEHPEWTNSVAEASMGIVKDTIHSARSLRADYRVANNTKADFYFRTESPEVETIVTSQASDFCTLAKGNFLRLIAPSEANPKNTCIKVVSDQLSLLVDLTGLIDVEQELQRLGKEKERLALAIDQLKRKVEAPGYDSKVPEAVRLTNSEKLNAYSLELDATDTAIIAFEAMRF